MQGFKNGPILFFTRILVKLYLYYVFISLMLVHNIFIYPWFYLSDLALFCMLYITDAKLDIILALFCLSCFFYKETTIQIKVVPLVRKYYKYVVMF